MKFLRALVNLISLAVITSFIGIIISIILAIGFVNSSNYHGDSDAGIGICGIGFFMSFLLTLSYIVIRTIRQHHIVEG